jgi:hypothetical protein
VLYQQFFPISIPLFLSLYNFQHLPKLSIVIPSIGQQCNFNKLIDIKPSKFVQPRQVVSIVRIEDGLSLDQHNGDAKVKQEF